MVILLFFCVLFSYLLRVQAIVPVFGVLNGELNTTNTDYAAGIRAAAIDIYWSGYEPVEGQFSDSYMAAIQQRIQAFRAVNFDVTIGVNLHNYPPWLLKVTGANYTNQNGGIQPGTNIVFSQTMRTKAQTYVAQIRKVLGPNFNVRVGYAPDAGELLYPPSTSSDPNSFWCFDKNAQGITNDLPPGVTPCPYPGWIPGSKTYKGAPFTTAMANTYYQWYIGALVKGGDWMQKMYTDLGFTGMVEWLMPGSGTRPNDYNRYVGNLLYGMADSSGNPWANNCTAADASVPINNSVIDNWSCTRWITYNANKFSLPKSAENPGPHDSTSVAWHAAGLMYTCQVEKWYYAHDFSLYDNYTGAANIHDYATIIKTYTAIWNKTNGDSALTQLIAIV